MNPVMPVKSGRAWVTRINLVTQAKDAIRATLEAQRPQDRVPPDPGSLSTSFITDFTLMIFPLQPAEDVVQPTKKPLPQGWSEDREESKGW